MKYETLASITIILIMSSLVLFGKKLYEASNNTTAIVGSCVYDYEAFIQSQHKLHLERRNLASLIRTGQNNRLPSTFNQQVYEALSNKVSRVPLYKIKSKGMFTSELENSINQEKISINLYDLSTNYKTSNCELKEI